jgi:hypothetical protein
VDSILVVHLTMGIVRLQTDGAGHPRRSVCRTRPQHTIASWQHRANYRGLSTSQFETCRRHPSVPRSTVSRKLILHVTVTSASTAGPSGKFGTDIKNVELA